MKFFTIIKNGLNVLSKIKNNLNIWICKKSKHSKGCHLLIEKTPRGDWEYQDHCSVAIRPSVYKVRCSNCSCIFINENAWDYKVLN
jgi:hypothetical protein